MRPLIVMTLAEIKEGRHMEEKTEAGEVCIPSLIMTGILGKGGGGIRRSVASRQGSSVTYYIQTVLQNGQKEEPSIKNLSDIKIMPTDISSRLRLLLHNTILAVQDLISLAQWLTLTGCSMYIGIVRWQTTQL